MKKQNEKSKKIKEKIGSFDYTLFYREKICYALGTDFSPYLRTVFKEI